MKLTTTQRECITDAGLCPLHVLDGEPALPTKASNHNAHVYKRGTLQPLITQGYLMVEDGRIKATDEGLYLLPHADALMVISIRCLVRALGRRG